MRYVLSIAVLCILAVPSCVSEAGLVVRGKVDITVVPPGTELWLAMYVEQEASIENAPQAVTRLSLVEELFSEDLNAFDWSTGLRPEIDAQFSMAAFLEPVGGDGYPNEGTKFAAADLNPFVFAATSYTSQANGKRLFNQKINIDFNALAIDTQERISAAADAFGDIVETVPTNQNRLQGIIHPAYSDIFGNDYDGILAWLNGNNDEHDLESLPLYGFFSGAVQETITAQEYASEENTKINEQNKSITGSFVQYARRSDNITVREWYKSVFFGLDKDTARVSGLNPSHRTVFNNGNNLILESEQEDWDGTAQFLATWALYPDSASQAVDVQSWNDDTFSWETAVAITQVTAAKDPAKFAITKECTEAYLNSFDGCGEFSDTEPQLLRIRLFPATETNTPFAALYVPFEP